MQVDVEVCRPAHLLEVDGARQFIRCRRVIILALGQFGVGIGVGVGEGAVRVGRRVIVGFAAAHPQASGVERWQRDHRAMQFVQPVGQRARHTALHRQQANIFVAVDVAGDPETRAIVATSGDHHGQPLRRAIEVRHDLQGAEGHRAGFCGAGTDFHGYYQSLG